MVQPEKATLALGVGEPARAMTLEDFRRRWPAWPVSNDQEGEDQAAAYAHVLHTLLIERLVAPGESIEGRLAFKLGAAREALVLKLPLRDGRRERAATLRWTL
ncbi:hypothetical protein D3C87_1875010 [compost metagenome]